MLACEAAMSRSSFAERFARVVGMTPLNYLLQWRLSVAKHLLAHEQKSVGETALAVGYESASGLARPSAAKSDFLPRNSSEPIERQHLNCLAETRSNRL
jgi:AraC-like DNA-binding protein